MKGKTFVLYLLFIYLLVSLHIINAGAQPVRDRVLDGVTVSKGKEYVIIRIRLNFAVRYIRHYPVAESDEVRIEFEPIQISKDDLAALAKRETIFPPLDNAAEVIRIEYEGSAFIQPTITVVFNRPKLFQVKQGLDYRSLVIAVPLGKHPKWSEGKRGKYVINLMSSRHPIDKTHYPQVRGGQPFTVYVTTYQEGEKLWYRLRVGFFNTRSQALKMANKFFRVRYPDLWITKATAEEMSKFMGQKKGSGIKKEKLIIESHSQMKAMRSEERLGGLTIEVQTRLLKEGEEAMRKKLFTRNPGIHQTS